MHLKRLSATLVTLAFVTFCSPAKADIVISIVPVSQTTTVGSAVSAEVEISGLGGYSPPALGAFDINVDFDPNVLNLTGTTFGDPILGDELNLSGFGSVQITTPGAGTVELFELSLDSISDLDMLQPPRFILGTLDFQAIGLGTSSLDLSVNALSDAIGDPLAASTYGGVIGTIPSAIPEPKSQLLLGSVLILVLCVGAHGKLPRRGYSD